MAKTAGFLLLTLAGWLNRRQQEALAYLRVENRVLREQLGPQRLLLTDDQRRRLALKGRQLGRRLLAETATLVTPETILRWHRRLVARKYDGSAARRVGRGRPRTRVDVTEIVVRIARENARFGYTRFRDTLRHLGHEVGRSTVKRILEEHGLEPARERQRRGMPWGTFLWAHWGAIAAADFFTAEALTAFGLVRYHIFFVMDLASRRVEIAGIASDPDGAWMMQLARNLTDAVDGFLLGKRHLILDRDPPYPKAFQHVLAGAGVQVVRLPARSPNLNALAERFVLSIKSECLDHLVPLGAAHLRTAGSEYVRHYHAERPHRGLGGAFVAPPAAQGRRAGPVVSTERLGGLLRHYHREAA